MGEWEQAFENKIISIAGKSKKAGRNRRIKQISKRRAEEKWGCKNWSSCTS